jgi:hypothetical protein
MSWKTATAFCLGACLATASAALVAGQQTTLTPGQMTEARVKIENRGPGEAVPVDLRDVNIREPLRVQVINGDITHPTIQPVPVRLVRPSWDYTTITLTADQDIARVLNARGAEGWETTGVTLPTAQGPTLVLKRQR